VPKKAKDPVILFVGRLKKAKKPLDALQAMAKIHEKLPKARGFIVGDGYLKDELKRQAPDYIKVLGRVSAKEKYSLMERAHVLLVPGIREGWGQVVIEANAFGTPCVGYDVPGLRDSIQDGKTGYLVQTGDADAMADATVKILNDRKLRVKFGKNTREWNRNFSWEKTAKDFQKIIELSDK